MHKQGYSSEWIETVSAYLAIANDRLADYSSDVCSWHNSKEQMRNTFGRFALPIIWDFTEVSPVSETSGGYLGAIHWIFLYLEHALKAVSNSNLPTITNQSFKI